MRSPTLLLIAISASCLGSDRFVRAQSDSVLARMRPLGTASAVDQFLTSGPSPELSRIETAHWQRDQLTMNDSASVRQMALMQSVQPQAAHTLTLPNSVPFPTAGAPPIQPPLGMNSILPSPPPITASQPGLPIVPSPSDQTPLSPPQLDMGSIARMDNCNLITGPSAYMSNSQFDCGCGQVVPTAYNAPVTQSPGAIPGMPGIAPSMLPAEIPSIATVVPAGPPPQVIITNPAAVPPPPALPTAAAPRAVISFGQDQKYAVQVGQGLWGQPVAYVPGQGFRNFFRYISP